MDCLGCRIVNQIEMEVNIVYENDYVVCLLDIAPFNDGHILIMPKQHYLDLDEIDEVTRNEIMNAAVKMSKLLKKVMQPDGITCCQNGGIFNDLAHYHMHVIPRFSGDGFSWSDPKDDFKTSRTLKDIKQMLIAGLV
ncbi:HIT family protein [Paenibacillus albiflavus]|uniref:HIT family protein n=1 Tax=Paenibacillus albiflavus TaxID=2545760 RepID=A0A4R4EHF4_9BACL|nr:HIT family protein [Paenibacillus albiflavus]TCZ79269.1 HIT family protein [Paenibacillus albiflavus]